MQPKIFLRGDAQYMPFAALPVNIALQKNEGGMRTTLPAMILAIKRFSDQCE
jgi:hypothetical protein